MIPILTDLFRYQPPSPEQREAMARVNEALSAAEKVVGGVLAERWRGVDQASYEAVADALIALGTVLLQEVPEEGGFLDKAMEHLMMARMDANQLLSGYPHELHSSRMAQDPLIALGRGGQWARAGIVHAPHLRD